MSLGVEISLENQIRAYCIKNNLNFNLLADMKKRWGIDMLKFETIEQGLSRVVLEVYGYGDNVEFKQTEHTKKHLSM